MDRATLQILWFAPLKPSKLKVGGSNPPWPAIFETSGGMSLSAQQELAVGLYPPWPVTYRSEELQFLIAWFSPSFSQKAGEYPPWPAIIPTFNFKMHITIWEFLVKKGSEAEFEKAYSKDGVWAQLFKKYKGYIETNLLKDKDRKNTYITIDKWKSKSDFENFKKKSAEEYQIIDKKCENLTEKETHLLSVDSD